MAEDGRRTDPFARPGVPSAAPPVPSDPGGLVPGWTSTPHGQIPQAPITPAPLPQPVPVRTADHAAPSTTYTPASAWTTQEVDNPLTALPSQPQQIPSGATGAKRPFPAGLVSLATAMSAWKVIGPIYLLAAGALASWLLSEAGIAEEAFGESDLEQVRSLATVATVAAIGIGLVGLTLLIGQVAGAVKQRPGMLSGFSGVLFAIDVLWLALAILQIATEGAPWWLITPSLLVAVLQGTVFFWALSVRKKQLQPWL